MTPDDAFAAIEAAVKRSHANGPVAVVVIEGDARFTSWAAACWAYRRRHDFPRDMYTVDLSEFRRNGCVDLAEVSRVMLRRLGVWRWRVPKSLPARITKYHQRAASRRVLIVIGNADAAAQVRALTAGHPGSVILATTRRGLTGFVGDGVQFVTTTRTYIGPTIKRQKG
ncbi:hypothetical protein SAMN05421837_107388 [Amycolatopsis pretoriensis]|uniref:Uncharacterized protein n=1 Tax=Amycolatopsis pretoriensis TaxID=218821 RepID=A0A1H5RAK0_9PSEU|nr:hypothetical protein [Amycolatopsis pretoriensis]SEF34437.1 hypothetical protein SAMN05421837_107388 [Amycolatopsis pretoriensis]